MFTFHDEGIYFEEEDPTSECYRPELCTNVYLDHAKGKFHHHKKINHQLKYDDDDYDNDYYP